MLGPVRPIGAPDDGLLITLAKRASELGHPALYGILHLSDLSKRLLLGVRGRSRRALEAAVWPHIPEHGYADRAAGRVDQDVESSCFVLCAKAGAPMGAEHRLHVLRRILPCVDQASECLAVSS